MYDQQGVDGDIEWEVNHLYDGKFKITVSNKESIETKHYNCTCPINFGMDMSDKREINYLLDNMIDKMRSDYY